MASIISIVRLGDDTFAAWFDDGTSKRYTSKEIGAPEKAAFSLDENGSRLTWKGDDGIEATSLYALGEPVHFAEDEKRRLLKQLGIIRRDTGFSQTRLGEAAGIRQSVISRIEGCDISPQINTLLKLLVPLGKTLAVVDLDTD